MTLKSFYDKYKTRVKTAAAITALGLGLGFSGAKYCPTEVYATEKPKEKIEKARPGLVKDFNPNMYGGVLHDIQTDNDYRKVNSNVQYLTDKNIKLIDKDKNGKVDHVYLGLRKDSNATVLLNTHENPNRFFEDGEYHLDEGPYNEAIRLSAKEDGIYSVPIPENTNLGKIYLTNFEKQPSKEDGKWNFESVYFGKGLIFYPNGKPQIVKDAQRDGRKDITKCPSAIPPLPQIEKEDGKEDSKEKYQVPDKKTPKKEFGWDGLEEKVEEQAKKEHYGVKLDDLVDVYVKYPTSIYGLDHEKNDVDFENNDSLTIIPYTKVRFVPKEDDVNIYVVKHSNEGEIIAKGKEKPRKSKFDGRKIAVGGPFNKLGEETLIDKLESDDIVRFGYDGINVFDYFPKLTTKKTKNGFNVPELTWDYDVDKSGIVSDVYDIIVEHEGKKYKITFDISNDPEAIFTTGAVVGSAGASAYFNSLPDNGHGSKVNIPGKNGGDQIAPN